MDMEVLKKKISSYRTPKGRLFKVPDELAMELLFAWEQWSGPATGFYSSLGVDYRKMAGIMGRAKKLKREGHFPIEEFKEVKVEEFPSTLGSFQGGPCQCIEISWDNGKLIRFNQVDQLVDFLKKVS